MNMLGSRIGTDSISPTETVSNIPNRFSNNPMQLPTLRVVSTSMDLEIHITGSMYGLTDHVSLIGVTFYQARKMDHITFQGAVATELERLTIRLPGFGDTTVDPLVRLDSKGIHEFHLNATVNIFIGSIGEIDEILAPIETTLGVRLPYFMQLGLVRFDLKSELTYPGQTRVIFWSVQGSAIIQKNDDSANCSLRNRFEGTIWIAQDWSKFISTSARIKAVWQALINCINARIAGLVQIAEPNNIDRETNEMLVCANFLLTEDQLAKYGMAFEFGMSLHRDLDGP